MKLKLYGLLTLILLGGTFVAYNAVYNDFLRFEKIYGTVFKVEGCSIPNPITTPCFWGAFFFLVAFFMSLTVYLNTRKSKEIIKVQNYLYFLLIGSTVFAWSNFTYELYKFYFTSGPKTSCSGIITSSPFLTPCFYGSVIYLLSLITIIIIKRSNDKSSK